jgi:hypothetical protein
MANLPTGTVTFLFTDIEGSTALLQRLGDHRYAEVLDEHRRLLRAAFAEANGQEVDTQGDAFLVAFTRARDALAAAWRPNVRSGSTPGPTTRRYACGWGYIPANPSVRLAIMSAWTSTAPPGFVLPDTGAKYSSPTR